MKKKRASLKRHPRIEFEQTGVAIGAVAGMLIGLVVELATAPGNMLIMTFGSIAGITLGAAVEGARYWWRKRTRQRATNIVVNR